MDPFVKTILKQAGVIAAGSLVIGIIAAAVFAYYRYSQLQHSLTLNMTPAPLS
jgi:hypothetical protein